MRIGNQNKKSGWNTLIFRPWSTNLLVSVGQTTRQRINYLCQRNNFNEWAQSAYLLVAIGGGIFYSVLSIVHKLHFFTDLGIGGPLNVGDPWL